MCNFYKRKNKKVEEYNGYFSASKFDKLQDQRKRIQRNIEEKDRRISKLITTLTRVQQEKDRL